MKKIYIAMAVLGTVLLSSCVREKNFNNNIKMGENEIAFVMKGVSTRSGEGAAAPVIKGVTIPMGKIATEGLYLEETIEYLNPEAATKGAPAYTVTLPDIYPTMGVYAEGNFGDAVFGIMDEALYTAEKYEGSGFRYNHNYNRNPWPASETDKVDFYLRMPASGSGLTASENTFELTTPLNGQEQMDVLFGQVSMSKKEHDAKRPDGMPVTMKHALTGIKFRNAHLNDTQTKTVITRVELVGLNMYGKGTVGTDGVVTWETTDPVINTAENPFYLVFDNDSTYDPDAGASNPDGTVTEWDSKLQGTSWTAENAYSDHNLNHKNGDLTFWFIPQEVPDDLVLNLEFYVKTPDTPDGTLVPHTINLGALLNGKFRDPDGDGTADKTGNLEWGAGQLRTYTLKPLDVDVEIEDKITQTVKSNLHIANTGNVDEYVRMMIMGNWYGWKPGTSDAEMASTSPSILVGYKYKDAAAAQADGGDVNDMVEPWYGGGYDLDDDPSTPNVDPYGYYDDSFELGKLGSRDGARNDWADASGGYYFTMPIGPGQGAFDSQSATKDLFKSYTVTDVPDIWIPVGNTRQEAVGVHLVMEIVIQAIAVPTDADGKRVWWLQAWYDATGIDKLDPEAERNAAYKTLYEAGQYDD